MKPERHKEAYEKSSIDPEVSIDEESGIVDDDDLTRLSKNIDVSSSESATESEEIASLATEVDALLSDSSSDESSLTSNVISENEVTDSEVVNSDEDIHHKKKQEDNIRLEHHNSIVKFPVDEKGGEAFSDRNIDITRGVQNIEIATCSHQENNGTKSIAPEEEQGNEKLVSSNDEPQIDKYKQGQLLSVPPQYKTPTKNRPKQLIRSENRRQYIPDSSDERASQSVTKKRPMTEQSSLFTETNGAPRHNALLDQKGSSKPIRNKVDLLRNFVEYKDQIHPTSLGHPKTSLSDCYRPTFGTKSRQSWPFSKSKSQRLSTSPLPEFKRQVGVDERRRRIPDKKTLYSRESYDSNDYDIPSQSVTIKRSSCFPMTPESQSSSISSQHREIDLHKHQPIHELNNDELSTHKNDLLQFFMTVLSTAVKTFCTACIVARCLTFIGGKRSLLYYLISDPVVWMVRYYILIFHAVLILVEMEICIPGLLPRGTLNNFVHRAFIQSFIGMLDMCMNTNRSISYQSGDGDIKKWVDFSYLVLLITPKGLVVCSFIYFILAVFSKEGRSMSFRRQFNGAQPELSA